MLTRHKNIKVQCRSRRYEHLPPAYGVAPPYATDIISTLRILLYLLSVVLYRGIFEFRIVRGSVVYGLRNPCTAFFYALQQAAGFPHAIHLLNMPPFPPRRLILKLFPLHLGVNRTPQSSAARRSAHAGRKSDRIRRIRFPVA